MSGQGEDFVLSPTHNDSLEKKNWLIQVKDGKFIPAQRTNSHVKELEWEKDQYHFSQVKKHSYFGIDAPNRPIVNGGTWQNEGGLGGEFIGLFSRQCTGLCTINGRSSVQVSTRQNVGYDDIHAFTQGILSQVKDQELKNRMNEELENAKKMQYRMLSENDSVFDLETGILISGTYQRRILQGADQIPVSFEFSIAHIEV